MSGHSKWHSIKHKKAAVDAKRGKVFTRIIKELAVAARMGGGDPAANPRLRTAIGAAKDANMPSANIERAIKRGTGELPGVVYEETSYEGYGPGGIAFLVETLTDNKNRTTADMRFLFGKHNGNLGSTGCVAYMFDKKGLFVFDASATTEDDIMAAALDAGLEDISAESDTIEATCRPSDFEAVGKAFDDAGLAYTMAEVSMIPNVTTKVEGKEAVRVLKLMEDLEDHDDVQKVYANFDIPDEVMSQMGA